MSFGQLLIEKSEKGYINADVFVCRCAMYINRDKEREREGDRQKNYRKYNTDESRYTQKYNMISRFREETR